MNVSVPVVNGKIFVKILRYKNKQVSKIYTKSRLTMIFKPNKVD